MKKIVLILLFILPLSSIDIEARRVKDIKYPALSLAYSPLNRAINRTDSMTESLYPYPVFVTTHPISSGLWIEKMVEEGSLNKGATLIYLSPYPCYTVGEVKSWQDSNWVRFVLERGYIGRALVVYPPYMREEAFIKEDIESKLSTVEDSISLFDSISQLPEGSELGEVVIVIDASYFSNQSTPRYMPRDTDNVAGYPISLIFSTYNTISGLKAKGIDVKAVLYNTSPGFPHLGHAAVIQEWLVLYLEEGM